MVGILVRKILPIKLGPNVAELKKSIRFIEEIKSVESVFLLPKSPFPYMRTCPRTLGMVSCIFSS